MLKNTQIQIQKLENWKKSKFDWIDNYIGQFVERPDEPFLEPILLKI